ncbi:YwgA family protein [Chungangia koreensis]|uniref:YwgA family protein n=1 Tax=Chungangia koreensis TaxID=752657 RepID=A0ABV8X6F3_9LACT
MLQEHAKIVQFVSIANGVTGRKKLQKMIYIAKKMRFPFFEKYELHMYGPYSEELTLRVEELCEMGFLNENKEDKGSYVQYSYRTTDEGSTFIETLCEENDHLTKCIDLLNKKSARFLELVSTLLYFDHLPNTERIEKVKAVKGKLNFTEEEMEEAFAFIEQLKACTVAS